MGSAALLAAHGTLTREINTELREEGASHQDLKKQL